MSLEMRKNTDDGGLEKIIAEVDELYQETKDLRSGWESETNRQGVAADYQERLMQITIRTNELLKDFSEKQRNHPNANEKYDQHFDALYLQIGLAHVRLSDKQ